MTLIEKLIEDAKAAPSRRVALPECEAAKTLLAARRVLDEGVGTPVLVSPREVIEAAAAEAGVSLDGMEIVDTSDEAAADALAERYMAGGARLLSAKGTRRKIKMPMWYAMVMEELGEVDCTFCGHTNTTGDVLMAAQTIIGLKEGVDVPSIFALVETEGFVGPEGNVICFADCGRHITVMFPAAPAARQGASYFSYYRQPKGGELQSLSPDLSQVKLYYAENLFSFLLKKKFEIYPLEDISQCNLLIRAQGICPDMRGATSMLAVAERNKSWARIIETKMAEIRKTDPDALFIVYAGMMHTSWIIPYAMPKFFASENPVVVEFTWRESLSLNTLGAVWTIKHPFFRFYEPNSLFYWTGAQARQFGRQTGFDYAVRLWFE